MLNFFKNFIRTIFTKKTSTLGKLPWFLVLVTFAGSCSLDNIEEKTHLAYVTNQKGKVLVIKLSDFSIVDEIDVGIGNRGLGITEDGKKLVVAVKSSNDLAIVNLDTRKITKRIYIGENPEMVRVRGDKAFVTFEPAAIGGPPPKPGSKEARNLEKKRKEENEERAKIAVVDIESGSKIIEIEGGMETEGIEFSYDGEKIIVTNEADENLSVHSIDSGELLKTIDTKDLGNRPRGIKRSETEKFYLSTLEYGNKLIKLDEAFNITGSADTGKVPYGISFSGDVGKAYVALAYGKAIQIFNTETMESVGFLPSGDRCWHFSFTPDQKRIIAACGRSNDLLLINVEEKKIEKKIENLKMPWGIVTFPKSYGTLDAP